MILFGYFRNPCIFESAAGLVSLHLTKAGAWAALRREKWQLEVNARELALRHGHSGKGSKPLEYEAFFVDEVEVLP
jgi:hypothetical protein